MINIMTRKIGGNVIATLIRGDNATTAIRFNVPERTDGVDLSGLSWAVLIRNAAGGTDVYVPAKAERDGHFITLDWFPGGVATAAAGLTEVMISGTAQADDPPVWQSATYYVRVDEKVDADPTGDDAVRLTELQRLIVFVSGELNGVIEAGRSAREAANRANEAAKRAESIAGVEIDATLTQPGTAADAAAVGGKIDKLSEEKADKKDIPAPYTLPTASAEVKGGVKVGNGLQMDGEVLGVHKAIYVHIETFTFNEDSAFERTQEPNGKAYALDAISMQVKKPAGVTIDSSFSVSVYFGNGRISQPLYFVPCTKTEERWMLSTVENYKGLVRRTRTTDWDIYNSTSAVNEVPFLMYDNVLIAGEVITRIKTNNIIPAGVTFEIWGVRADA